MKKFIFPFLLCIASIGCGLLASLATKQSYPFTDKARTRELLNIHESIAPHIFFNYPTAKIVFFSDLHRGMGDRDFFANNKALFRLILDYYYKQSEFILVILGDAEEGWGFQSDNIPLILQWHKEEYDLEKRFAAEGRYYRVYGNHDDYYRANAAGYVYDSQIPVYPALVFNDETNKVRVFATHGCQGHGLHDAGDQVAAWGVFARYNWLYEIMPKKEKESSLPKKMAKVQETYDAHERYFYDWACDKKYDILIGGHTHRPIYKSMPVSYSYEVLINDIKRQTFSTYSELKETPPTATSSVGTTGDTTKISQYIQDKMISQLTKEKSELEKKALSLSPSFPTQYYNTGCGYLTEMPCIEINGGNVFLKYFRLKEDGQLECLVYMPAQKSMEKRALF